MDCLICYKIFIKEAEYKNSSQRDKELCVNSLCKLLEISNSSFREEILENSSICMDCNRKLEKVNGYFIKLEELQRKITKAGKKLRNDLIKSRGVSEVMCRDGSGKMSKSSKDRLRLLKEIGMIENSYSTSSEANDIDDFEQKPAKNESPKKQTWDLCKALPTAFSMQSEMELSDEEINDSEEIPEELPIKIPSPKKGNKNTFQCDICSKGGFPFLSLLKRHQISSHHLGQKPIKCPHCSRRFQNKRQIKAHLGNKTPAHCVLCTKNFKSQGCHGHHNEMIHGVKYQESMKSMGKVGKPIPQKSKLGNSSHYKCEECNRYYQSEKSLKFHVRTHASRKFKCTENGCRKSFALKKYLMNHVIIHERLEFKCENPGCDKIFSRKDNRNRHQKYKCIFK